MIKFNLYKPIYYFIFAFNLNTICMETSNKCNSHALSSTSLTMNIEKLNTNELINLIQTKPYILENKEFQEAFSVKCNLEQQVSLLTSLDIDLLIKMIQSNRDFIKLDSFKQICINQPYNLELTIAYLLTIDEISLFNLLDSNLALLQFTEIHERLIKLKNSERFLFPVVKLANDQRLRKLIKYKPEILSDPRVQPYFLSSSQTIVNLYLKNVELKSFLNLIRENKSLLRYPYAQERILAMNQIIKNSKTNISIIPEDTLIEFNENLALVRKYMQEGFQAQIPNVELNYKLYNNLLMEQVITKLCSGSLKIVWRANSKLAEYLKYSYQKYKTADEFFIISLIKVILKNLNERISTLSKFVKPSLKNADTIKAYTRDYVYRKFLKKQYITFEQAHKAIKNGTFDSAENLKLKQQTEAYIKDYAATFKANPDNNAIVNEIEITYGIKIEKCKLESERLTSTPFVYDYNTTSLDFETKLNNIPLSSISKEGYPKGYLKPKVALTIENPSSKKLQECKFENQDSMPTTFSYGGYNNTSGVLNFNAKLTPGITLPKITFSRNYKFLQIGQDNHCNPEEASIRDGYQNYIPIQLDDGKIRFIKPRDPNNRDLINKILDEIKPGTFPEWSALETLRKERDKVAKINSTQELINNYKDIQNYFSIEKVLKKFILTASYNEAKKLISILSDKHFGSYCKQLGNIIASDIKGSIEFENRIMDLNEKILNLKRENLNKDLKRLPKQSLEYIKKNIQRIYENYETAQFINHQLKEACKHSKSLYLYLDMIHLCSEKLKQNSNLSIRVLDLNPKLETKLSKVLSEQLNLYLNQKNHGPDAIVTQFDALCMMDCIHNFSAASLELNKQFTQNIKLNTKNHEMQSFLQSRLKEFNLQQKELEVISAKYHISPYTLLKEFKREDQKKFQKEALILLRDINLNGKLNHYNEFVSTTVQWAFSLNERGKTEQAFQLKDSLNCLSKLLLGIWDAGVEECVNRTLGFLIGSTAYSATLVAPCLAHLALPVHITLASYSMCTKKDLFVKNYNEALEALSDGDFRSASKFFSKIGIEALDSIFLIRSITNLIRSDKFNNIIPSINDAFEITTKKLKEVNTGLVFNAKLAQNFVKSNLGKKARNCMDCCKLSKEKFNRRINSLSATYNTPEAMNLVNELMHNLEAEFNNIEVKGFNKKLNFDWDHLFLLDDKLKGFHFDYKNLAEKSKKIKFLHSEKETDGLYRALIDLNGKSKEKTFFPSDIHPKIIIKEIVERLKKIDFSTKMILNGKYIIDIDLYGGKINIYINAKTGLIINALCKHKNWNKYISQNLYEKK